jgi:hypothetical protein
MFLGHGSKIGVSHLLLVVGHFGLTDIKEIIFFVRSRLVIFLLVIFLCGCDFNIEEGDFNTLRIGMSKSEVNKALLNEQVTYIEPRVDEFIQITSESIGKLEQFKNTEGICITDNSGFDFHIVFDENNMSHAIDLSYNVDLSELGFKLPLPRKDTLVRIKNILNSRKHVVAFNCILDVKDMSLNDINISNLERINTWMYRIPNTHSAATMHFSNGKLVKIIYHWQPFEMP